MFGFFVRKEQFNIIILIIQVLIVIIQCSIVPMEHYSLVMVFFSVLYVIIPKLQNESLLQRTILFTNVYKYSIFNKNESVLNSIEIHTYNRLKKFSIFDI